MSNRRYTAWAICAALHASMPALSHAGMEPTPSCVAPHCASTNGAIPAAPASPRVHGEAPPAHQIVEGYLGSRYVYGELLAVDAQRVEGFIYLNSTSKVYVQGERVGADRFSVHDNRGNRFDLRPRP